MTSHPTVEARGWFGLLGVVVLLALGALLAGCASMQSAERGGAMNDSERPRGAPDAVEASPGAGIATTSPEEEGGGSGDGDGDENEGEELDLTGGPYAEHPVVVYEPGEGEDLSVGGQGWQIRLATGGREIPPVGSPGRDRFLTALGDWYERYEAGLEGAGGEGAGRREMIALRLDDGVYAFGYCPRSVRSGSIVDLPVLVLNFGDGHVEVLVSAESLSPDGPLEVGPARRRLRVEAGRMDLVHFEVKAGGEGRSRLRLAGAREMATPRWMGTEVVVVTSGGG